MPQQTLVSYDDDTIGYLKNILCNDIPIILKENIKMKEELPKIIEEKEKLEKEKEKLDNELQKAEFENENNISQMLNLNRRLKKLKDENKKLEHQNKKLENQNKKLENQNKKLNVQYSSQQQSQQQQQSQHQQQSQQQLQQLSQSQIRGAPNTRITRRREPYKNDNYDSQQQKQKDILRQLKQDENFKTQIKKNKINLAELAGNRGDLDILTRRLHMLKKDRELIRNFKKIFDSEGADRLQKSHIVHQVENIITKYDRSMGDIIYYDPKIHWMTSQRRRQR